MNINKIAELLKPYENAPKECDGHTQICYSVLVKAGIQTQVMHGKYYWRNQEFPVHYWLKYKDYFIDYRAKLWFPNAPKHEIPHGVFKPQDYPYIKYVGDQINVGSNYFLSDKMIDLICQLISQELINKLRKEY